MRTRWRLLSLAVALGVVLVPPAIHPVDAAAGPVYYLPATSGAKLVVTQGQNTAGDHDAAHYSQYALDFGIAGNGEFAVAAARAGTVIGLRDNSQAHCYMTAAGAYDWSCWKDANYVLVDHGDGSSALYVHLAMGTASVKVGDHVVAGQTLAMDDNTGFSSANHLHFMVESTPTVPSTPPPGPTDKTAVAWWWTNSKPVAFSDPSVLAQASDGIPKYGMTVASGSPTPAPTPTPRPAGISAKFTVPALSSTGIRALNLTAGQQIIVTASGIWCMGGSGATAECGGPAGIRSGHSDEPDVVLPSAKIGAVIAHIGSGPLFLVGASSSFTANRSGQLVLLFNDRACCYSDNSGSIQAVVSVSP